MTCYVDDAFCHSDDWGMWNGGGHLTADTVDELHAFASSIGLRRSWFQSKPGRPDHDHYDLTLSKRRLAIQYGATAEGAIDGARRRIREGRLE